MSEVQTVGTALLDEIERVTAKRERWRGYQRDMGAEGSAMDIGLALMTQAIEEGKLAVQSADPAAAIHALEELKGFDSND